MRGITVSWKQHFPMRLFSSRGCIWKRSPCFLSVERSHPRTTPWRFQIQRGGFGCGEIHQKDTKPAKGTVDSIAYQMLLFWRLLDACCRVLDAEHHSAGRESVSHRGQNQWAVIVQKEQAPRVCWRIKTGEFFMKLNPHFGQASVEREHDKMSFEQATPAYDAGQSCGFGPSWQQQFLRTSHFEPSLPGVLSGQFFPQILIGLFLFFFWCCHPGKRLLLCLVMTDQPWCLISLNQLCKSWLSIIWEGRRRRENSLCFSSFSSFMNAPGTDAKESLCIRLVPW